MIKRIHVTLLTLLYQPFVVVSKLRIWYRIVLFLVHRKYHVVDSVATVCMSCRAVSGQLVSCRTLGRLTPTPLLESDIMGTSDKAGGELIGLLYHLHSMAVISAQFI